jgi:protein tyrosine/serine phosphatase
MALISKFRFRARNLVFGAAAALAVILAVLAGLQLTGNFHTVVAGEFYRSAQPSPTELEAYIRRYGLKTVVNLRGAHPHARWYKDEKRVTEALGVKMIDFRMSASRELSAAKAETLVAMLKAAPKPILVHCKAGADRTGLVSVIYASQVAGIDEEDAEEQLWPIVYGHVGVPLLSPSFAMDVSWEALEPVFGIKGS